MAVSICAQELDAISKTLEDELHASPVHQEGEQTFESSTHEELHIVMVPYPLQGHINPMLQFANALVTEHQIRVSFINTKQNHDRIQSQSHQCPSSSTCCENGCSVKSSPSIAHDIANVGKLQYLCLTAADFDFIDITLDQMLDVHCATYSMKDPLKQLLQSLNQKSPVPISCVVFGSFWPWVHTIATELKIPSVFFWTQSASVLSLLYHVPLLAANGFFPYNKKAYSGCNEDDVPSQESTVEMVSYVPGVPPLRRSSFPTLLHIEDINTNFLYSALIREQFAILPSCQGVIVNSFEELEKDAYQALQAEFPFPVSLVGPLIPSAFLDKVDINKANIGTSLQLKERNECIEWLNSQEKLSVLYISFGTAFSPSLQDLASIADAIKAIRQPYLWVVRPTSSHPNVADILPKGFIQDTKDYGLIIPWAPQVLVLSHRSIGAFLTHCGWNSTIESVSLGVPMIPCPIISDQPTNCTFVCELWKVGIALKRHDDGSIRSLDVERVVRTLFQEREGDEIRKRAIDLREAARSATQSQGTSNIHIENFIQTMRNNSASKALK